MQAARRPGRQTTYYDGVIDKVYEYIKDGYLTQNEVIPTMAGLAIYTGTIKSTLIVWSNEHDDLHHAIKHLKDWQESMLISGSLSERYSPMMAKLILATNHGYSDKIHTTADINVQVSDSDAMRRLAFVLNSNIYDAERDSVAVDALPDSASQPKAITADVSTNPIPTPPQD